MTVNLKTLRADFEAKLDRWLDREHHMSITDTTVEPHTVERWTQTHREVGLLKDYTIDDWASKWIGWGGTKQIRLAAQRYVIARDFNEFDPERADMLWKLANGGAL